ncbi:hypothetical protein I4U23_001355 [Adineta vaga]|nr:hypothetical protein I4U23_001355 [Adineta vaga]
MKRVRSTDEVFEKQTKKLTILNRVISYIEQLPNEIFYEIFTYLECCQLFEAFNNLNQRFQHLLSSSYLSFHVQLVSNSISIAEYRARNIIVPNKHRILSLSLLNGWYDDQIFSLLNIDSSFNQLETLVLKNINADQLIPILSNLISLTRLFSLTIYLNDVHQDLGNIYQLIFHLPVLKSIRILARKYPIFTEILSTTNQPCTSIESMTINHRCTYSIIQSFFSITPHLSHLICEELLSSSLLYPSIVLSKLTHISIGNCKLSFTQFIICIKRHCPNVQVLRLITSNDITYLDIDRWEQTIQKYLSHLRKFHLQYYATITQHFSFLPHLWQINGIISPFWLSKQCLFECLFDMNNPSNGQMVYSIKYSKSYVKNHPLNRDKVKLSFSMLADCLDSMKCNDIIANNLEKYLLQKRFNHLKINCQQISINTLIKLVYCLSELLSLQISNLSVSKLRKLSSYEKEIVRITSRKSKIIEISLKQIIEFEQVKFFIDLCPRIEYLNLNCLHDINLEILIRKILIENISHLREVCFHDWKGNMNDFKAMINHQEQFCNYTMKSFDKKISLFRKMY